MNTSTVLKAIIFSFIFSAFLTSLSAHGVVLVKESGELLKLSESHIDVTIDNQISVVKSTQIYINETGEDINVKYGFPLDQNANPINIRWKLGSGAWKTAAINSSVQNPDLPSTGGGSGTGTINISDLDRYLGSNPLFFTPNDTIGKGEVLTLELTYVQLLNYSFGEVFFDYPYDYSLIQFSALVKQSFNVTLQSDRTIESFILNGPVELSTSINQNDAAGRYREEYSRAKSDISLVYKLSSDELGVASLSTFIEAGDKCDAYGEGFVSMIIEPQSNEEVEVIEKNFTLIIDRSGSMSRDSKMEQAQSASKFIVDNLNEGDFFNVISFNTDVTSLFPAHELISADTKLAADAYINAMLAGGSTNISGSLSEAITQFDVVDPGKANIIIFFTDGVATAGVTDTPSILEQVNQEVTSAETSIFMFTFGIGEDVDQQLLTLLALNNKGLVNFLENGDLEEEITQFFLRINNPVLIDLEMKMEPNVITDVYPPENQMPNLYKGEQLIVSGRYQEGDTVNMILKGKAFNLDVTYEFPIVLADTNIVKKSFLPKIWAKQKIDALTLDYYLEQSTVLSKAIQDDIDSISSCYKVVSLEFNSFSDGNVLEIDRLSFDVRLMHESQVEVTWTTAVEVNNDHFIVQRSSDGINWENIGKVDGAGNSSDINNYQFIDLTPLLGTSYYRLVDVNLNGETSYSELRAVLYEGPSEILIYPNPVKADSELFITATKSAELDISISDIKGTVVRHKTILDGQGKIGISDLSPGVYLCLIRTNSTVVTKKLVIK